MFAEERAAKLRMKEATLEEKLLLCFSAVGTASHQVSMQIESLKEHQKVTTKHREDTSLELSLSHFLSCEKIFLKTEKQDFMLWMSD